MVLLMKIKRVLFNKSIHFFFSKNDVPMKTRHENSRKEYFDIVKWLFLHNVEYLYSYLQNFFGLMFIVALLRKKKIHCCFGFTIYLLS